MPITFHQNIKNAVAGGLSRVLGSSFNVSVFSGTQPTADSVITTWTTTRTQMLFHHNNIHATHGVINGNNTGTGIFGATGLPQASNNALQSGTATWAILWSFGTMGGNVNTTTNSISTRFAVVPVSDTNGNGVLKYSTTTIVAGATYTPVSLTITIP